MSTLDVLVAHSSLASSAASSTWCGCCSDRLRHSGKSSGFDSAGQPLVDGAYGSIAHLDSRHSFPRRSGEGVAAVRICNHGARQVRHRRPGKATDRCEVLRSRQGLLLRRQNTFKLYCMRAHGRTCRTGGTVWCSIRSDARVLQCKCQGSRSSSSTQGNTTGDRAEQRNTSRHVVGTWYDVCRRRLRHRRKPGGGQCTWQHAVDGI